MGERLKGKVAVVTGSGRGIGRGIALAMVSEGAKLVINDIFRDSAGAAADMVVGEIKRAGGSAAANYDNVATMAGGENIIKTALKNFGRIDILVNCAGNFARVPALETTEEGWDAMMATHLKGHFACTKPAMLEMVKQKSGRIINFSSRMSFYAIPGRGNLAYAAAKAGILGFSATLAKDLQEYGITVNCILPSAQTQLFPSKKGPAGDNIPVPLTAEPDYVAPIIVYLCTDEAKNITGQFIYAAGGDIAIYAQPMQVTAAHRLVRKLGKWTLDELSEIIPPLTNMG